jgi:hypothetical protein
MEAGIPRKEPNMTRNLKSLAMAVTALALAVGALAATGAFAEEEEPPGVLHAAEYPAILDGTDDAGTLNAFTSFTLKIECPDTSYTGEVVKQTSVFVIYPTYGACKAGNRKVTITPNGCGYRFDIRNTTDKEPWVDNYFVTTSISCSGQDIEIHVYEAPDNENVKYCDITVKEQTLKDRVKLQNLLNAGGTTNGTLKLENEVQNITATQSGKCGTKMTTIARADVGIVIKGTTEGGGENSLAVTDS